MNVQEAIEKIESNSLNIGNFESYLLKKLSRVSLSSEITLLTIQILMDLYERKTMMLLK